MPEDENPEDTYRSYRQFRDVSGDRVSSLLAGQGQVESISEAVGTLRTVPAFDKRGRVLIVLNPVDLRAIEKIHELASSSTRDAKALDRIALLAADLLERYKDDVPEAGGG